MKFAICNETFGNRPFADTFSTIRKLGYTGVEIAPFTFAPHDEPFDLRTVPAEQIVEVRMMAEDAGLEIIGLHWLLAKTDGYYLTSPDPTVRRRTGEYLQSLAEVCADLGGKILVLRLAEAAQSAAGRFVRAMPSLRRRGAPHGHGSLRAIRHHARPRAARPRRGRLHAHRQVGHSAGRNWSTRPTASCTST